MAEKSIRKNAAFNVMKTAMSMLFPLITFPYASRILSPEGIGKVNFANSIVAYFTLISGLGIEFYGIREGAKVRHDKDKLSKLTMELFLLNLISTVVSYGLFAISLIFVPKLFDYRLLLLVCSSTIVFSPLSLHWLYGALEEYKFVAIRSMAIQLVSLVFLFVFVRTQDDYVIYACMTVISAVGANVCNLIHARKFVSVRVKEKLNIVQHVKPVMFFFGSALAVSVFSMLDTSMLGFLTDDAQVGYYSAATKLVRMIRDLFPAVFTTLLAKLSIESASDSKTELQSVIEKTLNFIMALSFPIIAGLLIFGEPVLLLLSGEKYIPAIPTLNILIPMILFSAWSGFLGGGTMLSSPGKEGLYLLCEVSGAVLNVCLNFLMIPFWKSFGAGFATLLTEFAFAIIFTCVNRKNIFFARLAVPFFQYLASTVLMAVVCYLINMFVSFIPVKLVCGIGAGIASYFVCLVLLRNSYAKSMVEFVLKKIRK